MGKCWVLWHGRTGTLWRALYNRDRSEPAILETGWSRVSCIGTTEGGVEYTLPLALFMPICAMIHAVLLKWLSTRVSVQKLPLWHHTPQVTNRDQLGSTWDKLSGNLRHKTGLDVWPPGRRVPKYIHFDGYQNRCFMDFCWFFRWFLEACFISFQIVGE